MNLKEVYEIFIRANVQKIHLCGMFPQNTVRKKIFLKNFFQWKYDGSILKSGMIKHEEADFFRIVKEKPDILHHYAHFYLNNHGLSRG